MILVMCTKFTAILSKSVEADLSINILTQTNQPTNQPTTQRFDTPHTSFVSMCAIRRVVTETEIPPRQV